MTGTRPLLVLLCCALTFGVGCFGIGGFIEPQPADAIDASTLDIDYEVPPTTPLPMEACQRVDIVFAVDDSGSMQEEMDEMRNTIFPAFADSLRQGIPEFRVGVIDACPNPATLHANGDGGFCGFQSGEVWMDSSSTALNEEFACVGDIYSGDADCSGFNDDEQPASSMAAVLENPAGTGEMMRDDALLVLIAVTDEDEKPTPVRSSMEIYERLVALKGGDVRQVVFLGIGGAVECEGEYGHAQQATRLKGITDIFALAGRGFFWDLCDGGLEEGLFEALSVIEEACEQYPNRERVPASDLGNAWEE
ncbi:MAG: hypothetical protein QF464_07130 [Myxococcota bacterium]|nr:hypothetical protein [Myxococcota bacterium]